MVQKSKQKLNLGCGQKKLKGYINVDFNPETSPDIIHDLNNFPYPFKDNSFKEILLDHVLEHLNDPIKVIIELNRISNHDGLIIVKSPHFSCNWLHPGHKSAISSMLFSYFEHKGSDYYGQCKFNVLSIKLKWMRNPKLRNFIVRGINAAINYLANLNIGFCQRVWCYWVGGFEEIEFRVNVKK
ncbi:MAG: methyltransferase domain-containing protein [archaeon]